MPTRELIGKRKTEAMETPAKQPTLANYWHPIALAADVIEQPQPSPPLPPSPERIPQPPVLPRTVLLKSRLNQRKLERALAYIEAVERGEKE